MWWHCNQIRGAAGSGTGESNIALCGAFEARVMHLSETRGPNERRANLQSCSVLGGEIFCVTECKTNPAYTPFQCVLDIGLLGKTVHNGRFRFMWHVTSRMPWRTELFPLYYWRHKIRHLHNAEIYVVFCSTVLLWSYIKTSVALLKITMWLLSLFLCLLEDIFGYCYVSCYLKTFIQPFMVPPLHP